jgi:hypothetical protein
LVLTLQQGQQPHHVTACLQQAALLAHALPLVSMLRMKMPLLLHDCLYHTLLSPLSFLKNKEGFVLLSVLENRRMNVFFTTFE